MREEPRANPAKPAHHLKGVEGAGGGQPSHQAPTPRSRRSAAVLVLLPKLEAEARAVVDAALQRAQAHLAQLKRERAEAAVRERRRLELEREQHAARERQIMAELQAQAVALGLRPDATPAEIGAERERRLQLDLRAQAQALGLRPDATLPEIQAAHAERDRREKAEREEAARARSVQSIDVEMCAPHALWLAGEDLLVDRRPIRLLVRIRNHSGASPYPPEPRQFPELPSLASARTPTRWPLDALAFRCKQAALFRSSPQGCQRITR